MRGRKNRGLSLIEILVASALMGVVALIASRYLSLMTNSILRVDSRSAALRNAHEIVSSIKADFKSATGITRYKWGVLDLLTFEKEKNHPGAFFVRERNQESVTYITNGFRNYTRKGHWLNTFMAGHNESTYAPTAAGIDICTVGTLAWPVLSRTEVGKYVGETTDYYIDRNVWPKGGGSWFQVLRGYGPNSPEKGDAVAATVCIDLAGSNAEMTGRNFWRFDPATAIISGVVVAWYPSKRGTKTDPPVWGRVVLPFSLTKTQTLSDIQYADR